MKAVAFAVALKIAMSLALAYAVGTATAQFIEWSFTDAARNIEQTRKGANHGTALLQDGTTSQGD